MSSLLDILHRKGGLAEQEPDAAEAAVDQAAQTVELRLAIDNGPAESTADMGLADEPAAEPSPSMPPPAMPPATAAPEADPFATQLLTALQLRQRSRRNGAWLGTGLLCIVLAAAVATWLLDEITPNSTDNDSLFTAVNPDTRRPAPPDMDTQQQVSALEEAAAAPPAGEQSKPRQANARRSTQKAVDTAWFDAPATEAETGAADELTNDMATRHTAEPIRIVRGTTTNPLFPRLSEAWAAFQAADYTRAETLYREVRAADPGNIDALLGLGALAARGNRPDEARDMYQAVVDADPRNAAAISALSTLPAQGSRQLDESALKNMLREQPGAANLHFALGLQYVAQGRWPDAQMAFFDAVSNDPTNADYAYNLAVSLDRLGQPGPAAAYYQRALNLANASALFSPAVAQARLNTLRPVGPQAALPQPTLP